MYNDYYNPDNYRRYIEEMNMRGSYNSMPQNYSYSQPQNIMPSPNGGFSQPMQNMMGNQMNNMMNNQMGNNNFPQQDVYIQSLFMEFLRSPEMRDFCNDFYSKFSQFYKNKTGLDFPYQNNLANNTNINAQPQQTNVSTPQMSNAQPNYIIERK